MANKQKPIKAPCYCPYCDAEIAEAAFPYCDACEKEIIYCPECHKPVPRGKKVCPSCGTDIKGDAVKGS